jgi:hypothetical protein
MVVIYLLVPLCGCYNSSSTAYDSNVEIIFDTSFVDHEGCTHPVCDVAPQCGCPEGFMCTIISGSSGTQRVCATPGWKQEGEPCSTYDCAQGLVCNQGVCRRACLSDGDCLDGGRCYRDIAGDGTMTCNIWCNAVSGENCLEKFRCLLKFLEDDDIFISDCFLATGNRDYLESCEEKTDCLQSYNCLSDYRSETGFSCFFKVCTDICQEDPMCPTEEPFCGSDHFFGTVGGIAYAFCYEFPDTGCRDD